MPCPGIPPLGPTPTLESVETTPYRPPLHLPQCPLPSPAAIIYHATSPDDVAEKRLTLSLHTTHNLPWLFSFPERLPSPPVACRVYPSTACFPQMKPGLHITALVFTRLVYRPTLSKYFTMVGSAICTQIGSRPAIRPSSA